MRSTSRATEAAPRYVGSAMLLLIARLRVLDCRECRRQAPGFKTP
jgi:hypothetical protein